ncbi:methylmalonyl-CoA mutase [Roseibium denhamense]|uniref:Heterodimeric methylmalonyl-CoA mutase small subunit n=1 Tax=Roseibium denhamense TaxID=76305 RepID=A0ABY1N619_9HYPH|nr:methylmalonyl-CoA mutase family protein [Roseibium denhamense]MTI06088.1 methylmalonyl-CoA mutase [Roseibium denhamense]SMP01195.1 heterodimeric methylmalonyl-CoA mutase small subunit [Roseibium denhamense]
MPLSFTGPDTFYTAKDEDWWAAVDAALKGAARDRLYTRTDDGLEIAPLYSGRADAVARSLRQHHGGWHIVQRIDLPDPEAANLQILEDLTGGASALDLVIDGEDEASGYGIRLESASDWAILYKDVQPDLIETRINSDKNTHHTVSQFFKYIETAGLDPASVTVTAAYDPNQGDDPGTLETMPQVLASLCEAIGPQARLLTADGTFWHNSGASEAQELALVLASGVAHLRMLEKAGLAPETWAGRISLSLAADADQFGTISKARAVRKLWASVLAGAGLPQDPADLHMVTSQRMLTRRDPWVNLLRNTVASFAAGIGGADGVCVLPHTQAIGLPDGFARRLARNTQSMLLEESSLAKVMDPSTGAGAIEARTDQLCESAWAFFQAIEASGGLLEARKAGLIDEKIAETRTKTATDIARRKRPVTGVSEFPNLGEKPVAVLSTATPAGTGWRYAEPFEALRDAADDRESVTGRAPALFLASLGSLAQFTARATWIANAFAAGGIKASEAAVYSSLGDMIEAFKNSGARIACIVSSDPVYEGQAEEAAKALLDAGAEHIYLAGKPGAQEAAYKAAGIGTFVFAGCDILALLRETHARLGVEIAQGAADLEDHA